MSKIKKIIGFAIVSAGAYFGFKFYQRMRSSIALSNNLPTYLNNLYEEKPKLRVNMTLKDLSLKLTFSDEILKKNDDIEAQIREYIEDFHDALKSMNINIEIEAKEHEVKSTESEDETNVKDDAEEEKDESVDEDEKDSDTEK